MTRREQLQELTDVDLIFLAEDYFDEAIIGVAADDKVVYSVNKCLEALMKANNWTDEEATDWFWYNTAGGRVDSGPVFIYTL